MQSNSMKFLSAIREGNLNPAILIGNREFLMILTTSVAVFTGCVFVFVWWKYTSQKSSKHSETPKTAKEEDDDDDDDDDDEPEVDDGNKKKKVALIFGTQTGTAKGFAKALAKEGRFRYEISSFKVLDVDDYATTDDEYEENLKKETFAFFFLATYGDGEPTDSAARFYKWLKEGKEKGNWLQNLHFGVFGLGNKQYEKYNKIAIEVDELLAEQGGKRLVPVGLGNDDKAIEEDFKAWLELVWPKLDQLLWDVDDAKCLYNSVQ